MSNDKSWIYKNCYSIVQSACVIENTIWFLPREKYCLLLEFEPRNNIKNLKHDMTVIDWGEKKHTHTHKISQAFRIFFPYIYKQEGGLTYEETSTKRHMKPISVGWQT